MSVCEDYHREREQMFALAEELLGHIAWITEHVEQLPAEKRQQLSREVPTSTDMPDQLVRLTQAVDELRSKDPMEGLPKSVPALLLRPAVAALQWNNDALRAKVTQIREARERIAVLSGAQ